MSYNQPCSRAHVGHADELHTLAGMATNSPLRTILAYVGRVFDRIDDLLGIGGLDTSDYMEQLESAFAITIPDDDAVSIETLGQLRDYVQERVIAHDGSAQIWNTILDLTSDCFGVPVAELSPHTRFVDDLGC